MGTGFGFGIFVDGRFVGEITLSSIQRGPLQSAFIGYWIDEAVAGQGLMPEAVVTMLQYAFESLRLHRVEINIIPRNAASRRVVEKLGLRFEGIAERYLEIDGAWEDHARYAITAEEWGDRAPELVTNWLLPRRRLDRFVRRPRKLAERRSGEASRRAPSAMPDAAESAVATDDEQRVALASREHETHQSRLAREGCDPLRRATSGASSMARFS